MHKNTVYILSQFSFNNYGNRLQSCAIVKLLKLRGINPTVIIPCHYPLLRRTKDFLFMLRQKSYARKRQILFRRFSARYTSYVYMSYKRINRACRKSLCTIIGSDQVWSPFFLKYRPEPEVFFLTNISPKKKIPLAPSFGMGSIPQGMADMYKKGLYSFDRLSVREESGASIIRNMVGIDPVVLSDPVFGQPPEWWRSISNDEFCPSEAYLLTYYLGSWNNNARSLVEDYASMHNLLIVDIMDENSRYHGVGPAEFLALIDHADYFVTDSFHGAAFATMFNTSFCITRRLDLRKRDMFDRIITLVEKNGLKDRVLQDDAVYLPDSVMSWDSTNQAITYERRMINEYLDSELERCDIRVS